MIVIIVIACICKIALFLKRGFLLYPAFEARVIARGLALGNFIIRVLQMNLTRPLLPFQDIEPTE